MTSEIRAMFVFQAGSGKPEDAVVNTFHFTGPGTYDDDKSSAILCLTDFYTLAAGASAVGEWLSPWLNRSAHIRTYDMSLEKPAGAPKHWRVPTIANVTVPAALSNSGMPEEVAVCVSIQGVVPPALSGRRRGRIYIGPLISSTNEAGTSTTPSRPSGVTLGIFAAAAERMIDAHGVTWSIMSERPTKNFVRVAAGWVDNAWDTQRRRGPDPTARTQFGFPSVGL